MESGLDLDKPCSRKTIRWLGPSRSGIVIKDWWRQQGWRRDGRGLGQVLTSSGWVCKALRAGLSERAEKQEELACTCPAGANAPLEHIPKCLK